MSQQFKGHEYRWQKPFNSVSHMWRFRCRDGGISFHASIHDGRPACGLEFHSVYPRGEDAPDHLNCEVTGGRCWHDGTSLYAVENLWPQIEPLLATGNHDTIFRILEHESKRLTELRPDKKDDQ